MEIVDIYLNLHVSLVNQIQIIKIINNFLKMFIVLLRPHIESIK